MGLALRIATEDEKRERDRLTYAAWGERLTIEQYLAREQYLRCHAWAQEAMETWLLCAGEGIVCSCESLQMPSRIGGQQGTSWGIASVFTEEAHRGHRYASQLVGDVATRLLARPGAQAVVLYSEVGAPIYERAGFAVAPTVDWIVQAEAARPPTGLMLDDELAIATASIDGDGAFSITPSAVQLDWHLARERYYATTRNRRAPARHRLRYGAGTVMVMADLKHGELLGLAAELPDDETAEILLRAVGDLAWQLGLARAKLWAVDGVECPGFVAAQENESSLAMIRSAAPVAWRRIARGAWV